MYHSEILKDSAIMRNVVHWTDQRESRPFLSQLLYMLNLMIEYYFNVYKIHEIEESAFLPSLSDV